uniref:Protein m42.1 n=1 Tax=Mastomys natalensis cytomegalovirus 2 TaxID=2973540 RepID=A0A9Y1ILK7_9BETA|nr:protein m42.1 [Mastomys natalensis cytomegalovirus 2]WEG69186.1 protein m42.1 [Mastomys natalensis cytomegalovirus 2]WEG69325.1 protein m42.1 [Mastomys natalensis cytomegalovirus 2]WEG69463.1 protein m42.1 [Mastomys natalensis cytomegalovirus 2]WEG69601.1 protein m42.1 [Mastomys natalensis cytomegalovirus 2]
MPVASRGTVLIYVVYSWIRIVCFISAIVALLYMFMEDISEFFS